MHVRWFQTLLESPGLGHISDHLKFEVESVVDKSLSGWSGILLRDQLTLEQTRGALSMVNLKLPPNGPGNQQFKDSLIWQSALNMAKENEVHFVTGDKGFFAERDPRKGVASNLIEDCNRLGVTIFVHYEVGACLKAVAECGPCLPDDQRDRLLNLLIPEIYPRVEAVAKEDKRVAGSLGSSAGGAGTR